MNSAIGSACSCADNRQRFRREPIDPFRSLDRLPSIRICSLRGPVTFILDVFVGNRAFHDQHERIDLTTFGLVKVLHEVVAHFIGQHRIVQVNFRKSGNGAQKNVFDARLFGGGDGDGIAIATQAGSQPDDVNIFDW